MTLRTQYDELPHISRPFGYSFFKSIKTMRTGSNYFLGLHTHSLQYSSSLAFGTRTHFLLFFAGSPVQLSSVLRVLQRERLHDSKFVQMLLLFFLSKSVPAQPKIVLGCFP
jgi:hypothetical protein